MFSRSRYRQFRPWRALALGVCIALAPPVSAVVTTDGCSQPHYCTGAELNAGGSFTIDDIAFYGFVSTGVFAESEVRFSPFDDPLTPGILVERMTGYPLFRAEGVPTDASDAVVFSVASRDNRAILRRTLVAEIGNYVAPVTAYVGAYTYRLDTGEIDLSAVCYDPQVCWYSYLSDARDSEVAGSIELVDYSLGISAFIGDETNPEDAVLELVVAFFQLEVEPHDRYEFNIISGSKWLSNDTEIGNWYTLGFDDSTWVAARAPYPSPVTPTDLIHSTTAQFMWHDPDGLSDGGSGPIRAYFRYPFELDLPVDFGYSAVLQATVDDDYDLYVNDTLVIANHDGGFADVVDTLDITGNLEDGENVIAIYAVDGSWDVPYPRGYERVLLDTRLVIGRYEQEIRSGSAWKTSDVEESGWQDVAFDDSGWAAARSDYPGPTAPQTLINDTLARPIWHDPTMSSDGGTGPVEAFFRFNFFIPVDPDEEPFVGRAKVNADDDYDLYVNGELVFRNNDGGFADQVDEIDFTDALVAGANVIAVRAADGSGDNPYPRGYERLLFDGLIATGQTDFANDVDGDSVANGLDNCITSYNPAQTDTNGDGYGNTCDGDLDGDLVINVVDLGLMKQEFFTNNADADLNVDGYVNAQDLGILRTLFFKAPGPSALVP